MGTDRARLLLHPVRMRVVIALSGEELTTRDLQKIMPEVPQASLYRAISQLHDAGVIEVVSSERRGGAMERTYRAVPRESIMTQEEFTSGTAEEFLATMQAFADQIVSTTTRYVGTHDGDEWKKSRFSVRHGVSWLTAEERGDLAEELGAIFAKYEDRPRRDGTAPVAINVAVVPDVATERGV
ncbi:helix-turn-helix domain-containing protein [Demequina sp. NBRC 110051]|uniref:helix-turn-helix domain-containing protein n=1 Tax=Demequina sp. NBRC 110051 TaxID=1570340 RepID=UPI0009FE52F3|nr:helix-turn-helix domain-containing protein [Demequina sp. NBRC 110051]